MGNITNNYWYSTEITTQNVVEANTENVITSTNEHSAENQDTIIISSVEKIKESDESIIEYIRSHNRDHIDLNYTNMLKSKPQNPNRRKKSQHLKSRA